MTADEYEDALDDLMGRILRRLTLLSDGKASVAPDARGGSPGKAGDVLLRLGPPDWGWDIRSLKNRYSRAHALDTKRGLIAEALRLLTLAKYAPNRSLVRGTKEWKEKIARDERSPSKVALVFDISRPTVYKYRKEFKVNGSKAA